MKISELNQQKEAERLKKRLRAILDDPVRYAEKVLRHDVWETPAEILRSVASAERSRTAVKACHASSKTFTAAEAVLWWVTRYSDGIAITTAPTWTQVERLLWGEIRKALARSWIKYPDFGRTELRLKDGSDGEEENFALGISTNQGVRFQGWHGRILIVVDEAVGLRPDIWEAIEGIRAGGDVRLLVLLNPTIPSGYTYEIFTASQVGWNLFTISGLNTPNTKTLGATEEERLERILKAGREGDEEFLNDNKRPYLLTRSFIWEKWNQWSPQSPLWQARVLGLFPDDPDNAVYPLSWLETAKHTLRTTTGGPCRAGVDVAGPGKDETVATVVRGPDILAQKAWMQPDPRGEVMNFLKPYKADLEVVNVDSIGMGYYFARHLEDHGFPVQDINVSEDASDEERFYMRKAEVYWGLRERLEQGRVAGLTDDITLAQLSTILWDTNANGQIVIESKEKRAKRGLKSPDRAESVVLAYIPPAEEIQNYIPAGQSHYTG